MANIHMAKQAGFGRHTRLARKQAIGQAAACAIESLEARVMLANDLYVDIASPGPTHDGSSWDNAYADLQLALAAATSGDRILVADGTYKPTAGTDRTISFALKSGVSLLGGYAGYGAADPDAHDVSLYHTILSGDIGLSGSNADNSYHIVTGDSAIRSDTILDGVTITAANANGAAWPQNAAGGIYLNSASPSIANCTISANSTSGRGGGMFLISSSPDIVNCTFIGNSASQGGGMFVSSASPATLAGCTFRGNSAGDGGGIWAISTFTMRNSSVTGNTASSSGGGLVVWDGSPVLVGCAFTANSSVSGGGAIYKNSTTPLQLTNCSLVANTTFNSGGGIYEANATTLVNCIVWNNSARLTPSTSQLGGSPVVTYSDIQGGFTGTGNVNTDPAFVRDPFAGGDGAWGTADDDYGDVRLWAGSPLADAGNNGAAGLAGVLTDLFGNPRFADIVTTSDTGSGVAPVVDIGPGEAVSALEAAIAGTYRVPQGPDLVLRGLGASDTAGTLSFTWDFDSDGLYDDASGPNPVFVTSGYLAPTSVPISLRVTDSAGHSATASGTVLLVPQVLYVDASATGSADGSSWANAFTNPQAALLQAISGCEIHVADGVYKPTTTTDRMISFQLKDGVWMMGGYAGYGATDPDARDPDLFRTVLSGDIGALNNTADDTYNVVFATSVGSDTVIDGFTITGGNANLGKWPYKSGGGMHVWFASPTVSNCRFVSNSGTSGGGMYIGEKSSPRVDHCTFIANSATDGGGLYNDATLPLVLTNCTFAGNSATGGGGVASSSAVATDTQLSNCILVGNKATTGGGISGRLYTITNCTLVDNAATNTGAAMTVTVATLTNTIVWASAPAGNLIATTFAPSITYSDIQGGYAGTGNLNADPFFTHNPSPGADLVWGSADDDYGDLRILPLSPLADTGDNNAPGLAGITLDPAGAPRFNDVPTTPDTGVGTSPVIDMGAYEAVPYLCASVCGPYKTRYRFDITLQGRGASSVAGALDYAWDFDNDGLFDDATAANPLFPTSSYVFLTVVPIAVRVTDADGHSVTATTTVTVYPDVMYVDDTATGSNDGSTWANAFTDLQSALGVGLLPGCEIHVAGGTYRPTATTDRAISFQLQPGVGLYGGYAGDGAADANDCNPALYPSILSGDIGISGNVADNSYHVLTGTRLDETAVLDGFTITAGNASGSPAFYGGGIYLYGASPRIVNCSFIANSATQGGGLYCMSPDVTAVPQVIGCEFRGNSASYGGGIYSGSAARLAASNSKFFGNAATTTGGAVYTWDRSSFVSCIFVGNTAGGDAGVYGNTYGCTLTSCTFAFNSATNYGGAVGSIASGSWVPVIVDSILWGNQAPSDQQISGWANVTYSDIQGGYSGTGNMNVNPRFLRDPSRGLDGQWGTVDDDYGDLRLRAYSPVADAGNNAAAAGMVTDLYGNPRFMDVPTTHDAGVGSAPVIDMGAYEAVPALEAFVDGPYLLKGGPDLVLTGLGASDIGEPLTFAWDYDNDGLFDDATGANPAFETGSYTAVTTVTIRLQITDSAERTATASNTVTIVPPVLYVDDSAIGAQNGSSWANAFTDVQSAQDVALEGCEIRVAAGTYRPTTTTDRTISFVLQNGVTLSGGYAGYGATNPDARDATRYLAILSGDLGVVGNRSDNSYHVVTGGSDITATSVLDGFTITAGNANGLPSLGYDCGGGVYLTSASPTVLNCRFVGNLASYDGGGMYNKSSSPRLVNCVFIANSASYGGGMKNYVSSAPQLTNCTFVANSASGCGGGIYHLLSSAVLTNCILWGNTAPSYSQVDTSATITYSDVQGGYSGTGNISVDPRFVRTPSVGDDGDPHLQSGSPCINSGSDAAPGLVGVNTDITGGPRIIGIVEMGAYECDQAPTDVSLSPAAIVENQAAGAAAGTLSTMDPDAGNTFTYSLVSGAGSTDNASFTINGDQLLTAASFNYEAKSSYSIRVRTTDQGGLWFEKALTITVTNVNETPTDVNLSSSSIMESQPVGTAVGTLSTTDPDAGNTFTYSLVSGSGSTDNASFTISGSSLQSAEVFDLATRSSYSIRVRTTDQGGLWFEKVLTITVTKLNLAPTDIALSASSIAENQVTGTAVGTLSTTDPDAGNTFTYSLVSGTGSADNASFTISGGTLQTAAIFNFEAKSSYSIRVRTTDQGGLWFEKAFAVTVTDVNETPTNISLSASSVMESQPVGTPVGTLSSTDPDAGNTFTYSLVSGSGSTNNASFTISGSTLQTAAIFNFATKSSYSIRLRTTDQGGLWFEKVFTITVTKLNLAPTDISLSVSSIAENRIAGTAVGTLSTSDPDAGNTFTYSLVSGTDSSDNGSFTISGNQLLTAASFNFEAKNSYSIRVRTTDQGGLWAEKNFTINVTNVNEAPTDTTLSPGSIAENRSVGTTVGTFSTVDPDAGDTFTYLLVSGVGDTDNSSFTISGNSLRTAAVFDFETQSTYSIRVRTTDAAGLFFGKIFTITVTYVAPNRTPTDIALSASSIAENQPVGTAVGALSSTDPDTGNTFTYSLVSGTGSTDNSSFTISGNTLQTAAMFDYEAKSSYSIRLRTTDQGGLSFEKTFTISVTDVDEIAPTVTAVYVKGSTWTSGFLSFLAGNVANCSSTYGFAIPVGSGSAQLQTLPWRNINRISVAFSEDVSVSQAQFAIAGSVGSYSVSGFAYNVTDHVATWSLSAVIGPDKLYIALPGSGATPVTDTAGNALDGEWTNPSSFTDVSATSTFPSGNGVAGGDFAFRFDVLPGDSTGGSLGKVNVADVAQTKSRSSLPETAVNYRSDVDGNNILNVADVAFVKSKSTIYSLPVNPPVLPIFGPVFSSVSLLLSRADSLLGKHSFRLW